MKTSENAPLTPGSTCCAASSMVSSGWPASRAVSRSVSLVAAVRPERETCSSPGSSATIAASSAVLTRFPLWPRASDPLAVARKVGWAFSQTEDPVVE